MEIAEALLLWLAIIIYVVVGSIAIISVVMGKRPERTVLSLLVLGLLLHAIAIGLRWVHLGHGPYLTMFEILSSNIWSLLFIFTLAYWRFPSIRPIAAVVVPILFTMMGWLLLTDRDPGHLPPTYNTVWLVIHIVFGKIFLGLIHGA